MQVDFQYKDGRVVRMGRQYADVLRRLGKGTVTAVDKPQPIAPEPKPRKAKKAEE